MGFSDFISIFAMSFRILFVFYRNTKISGISDKAKSLATFCCSGVSKNIKYSVAEFKYNKMCMKKIIIIILCLSLSSLSFAQVFDIQSNLNRAENGDIEAAAKVGLAYYFQHKDVEAFKWLKIAGEKGYSTVYSLLGMMYHTGRGVAQNDQEALIWSKKAAENGDPQGWYLYGLMKGLGQGSPVDYPTSLFYLKKAAESGISDACMGVGHIYFYGKGVIEDYNEAYKWYKLAADKNPKSCAGELSFLIYYGLGTSKNYSDAKIYAEKAIQNGDALGYRIMALLYIYGRAVDKDKDKAFSYIDKALELSHNGVRTTDVKGELYAVSGDMNKAREIYEQLQKKFPGFYAENNTVLSGFIKEHKVSQLDDNIYSSDMISENTFAVIIGNEKYQSEKLVDYAVNDGEIFSKYCVKTLGLPEKNIHFVKNATLNNIKHEIKWLQDIIKVYNGDAKVIFYYAGHGIPDEQNKSAYLLPVDGYGSDITTGYAIEELYKSLGCYPAKSVVIFLDACFSGASRDGNMLASARGVAIKVKANIPSGNLVVFTAAQGDETAYPYKEECHGLFTYYLLKNIQETKGNVSLGELGNYIKTHVERQSIVINGKLQSPSILVSPSIGDNWKEWKLR